MSDFTDDDAFTTAAENYFPLSNSLTIGRARVAFVNAPLEYTRAATLVISPSYDVESVPSCQLPS